MVSTTLKLFPCHSKSFFWKFLITLIERPLSSKSSDSVNILNNVDLPPPVRPTIIKFFVILFSIIFKSGGYLNPLDLVPFCPYSFNRNLQLFMSRLVNLLVEQSRNSNLVQLLISKLISLSLL